jgi:hypothetical protein
MKRPFEDLGKLPLPDRAATDEFVDQTKTLVGALGWDLFHEMRGRPAEAVQAPPGGPETAKYAHRTPPGARKDARTAVSAQPSALIRRSPIRQPS